LFLLDIYTHRLPRFDFLVIPSFQHQHPNLFSDASGHSHIYIYPPGFEYPRSHGATIQALYALHLHSGTNNAPPISCLDISLQPKTLYISVHDTQSGPFGYRITAPLEVHNNATLLEAYCFEVKYMACWKIYTRGFDNPFREDLMQILKLIAENVCTASNS
jgi:hypothetical protein